MTTLARWLLVFSICFSTECLGRKEHFIGAAEDATGRPLYTEHYSVEYQNGEVLRTIIVYLDLAKLPLARLEASTSPQEFLPNYTFENFKLGHKEGVRCEKLHVVSFTRSGSGREKTKPFRITDKLVSGPGLHFFIRSHLKSLNTLDSHSLDILLPGRRRIYGAYLSAQRSPENGLVYPTLRPKSFIAKLMVGNTHMIYEADSERIMEYFGVSNIKKGLFAGEVVRIKYSYPETNTSL